MLLDGADVRDVRLDELRRAVGMVSQDPFLFSTTVRENIAYGRPDAAEEEIRRAAGMARADGFIEALPDGYDTVVGERGLTLSGGQRQRLAIARVTAMSMTRPPKRSVSGPLTSRPNDPTRIGVATSSDAWVLLSASRRRRWWTGGRSCSRPRS